MNDIEIITRATFQTSMGTRYIAIFELLSSTQYGSVISSDKVDIETIPVTVPATYKHMGECYSSLVAELVDNYDLPKSDVQAALKNGVI